MTQHVLPTPARGDDLHVAAACGGVLLLTPGRPGWDEARLAWNRAVDQQPAAVAIPRSVRDVRAVVSFAAAHGLRVVPQSTGHNAAPLGDLSDAVLVRMHEMRGVVVDPAARTATVQGGAQWADVTAAAGEHGLAALAGSSFDVGVAGYVTGGGVSWLGRRYGLAANHVLALDVVTADGVLRRVDADHEPDLFWAIRGGGGNLGVVVGVTLRLFDVRTVYAGSLFFPLERFAEVVSAYDSWVDTLPETASVCVRALRLPPVPDLPDTLRGQEFVVVNGAVMEDPGDAALLVAPLRDLGPVLDDWGPMPASELWRIHLDPPGPVPSTGDGLVVDALPPEAVAALDAAVGAGSGSPLLMVELRLLGGALGRPSPQGGAVSHLEGRYSVYAVGVSPTPEAVQATSEHVRAVHSVLQPWAARRHYLNLVERAGSASRFHDEPTLGRLREVRRRFDPDGVMAGNHSLDG